MSQGVRALLRALPSAARTAPVARCTAGAQLWASSAVARRLLHVSAASLAPTADFDAAVKAVNALPSAPSNEVKLKMYALFKQATVGKNTSSKPGVFDVVGKFKWQAWADLGEMTPAQAEREYIDLARSLGASAGGASAPAAKAAAATDGSAAGAADKDRELVITTQGAVREIKLNRPAKRNAITFDMYHQIVDALEAAAKDPAVNVVVLTGAGAFYCAGNDLSNFAAAATMGPEKVAEEGEKTLKRFVAAFIHFPKMLVVGLNGPCIGIAMTTLPLADLVYASHKATLHAPLTALGQTPEGTGSYTFLEAMGPARANELLLMGRKITASEGREYGLVNEVFEDGEFRAKLAARVGELAALPPQALTLGKKQMRDRIRPALDAANEAECALIKGRWLSDECMSAVARFMSKGGKA
jgi:peroxisomal 3,2-trans-enoyl-CoA isomerase